MQYSLRGRRIVSLNEVECTRSVPKERLEKFVAYFCFNARSSPGERISKGSRAGLRRSTIRKREGMELPGDHMSIPLGYELKLSQRTCPDTREQSRLGR